MLSPPGGQRERRTKSLNAILAIMLIAIAQNVFIFQ